MKQRDLVDSCVTASLSSALFLILTLLNFIFQKQEHEEKIKAELRAKTELISLMSKTLVSILR